MSSQEVSGNQTRLIPLSQWHRFHPWPSVPAMRWKRFNQEREGMVGVFKKVGKTVLVDEQAFFNWVEEQNQIAEGN